MKKVLIAGYFDPLHDGHLDHFVKAAAYGDIMYIVTHTDECTKRVKGACFTTYSFRQFMLRAILKELGMQGLVLAADTENVASIIRQFKPDIFAKGGDRTESNMPKDEIEACQEVGCRIVYDVGDKLNSSSEIKAKLGGKA